IVLVRLLWLYATRMYSVMKPFGLRNAATMDTAVTIHSRRSSASGLARKRRQIDSAQYAPITTKPMKKPPWQFAQNRNIGGSAHIQRRDSMIRMVATISTYVI